jgi:hypothetical protein
MPRPPTPITLIIEIDDSPAAQAQFLEAMKLIVRRVHARRARVEDPQGSAEANVLPVAIDV